MIPSALTIAGSDPSGGAGLQADLKTFHQFGVYGQAVVTLITVQNTLGVTAVEALAPSLVLAQLQAVLSDIQPSAMKTGALGSDNLILALASNLASNLGHWNIPLVLDPVLFSNNGTRLTDADPRPLFPFATLITPNLAEAAMLTLRAIETVSQMRDAASELEQQGARSVLIKGGHLEGNLSLDVLLHQGIFTEFPAVRIPTEHTHGTGCTFSAAITALLAQNIELPEAVAQAKAYITEAIRTNPGLGRGQGPVNHWASTSHQQLL